ncbi:MAG: hypothetical protein PHO32_08615, partial [Candidatus Cloacimonetes bacterium]|nr:hypothetical protein [Candidatus Cloacimonadota bacterium]
MRIACLVVLLFLMFLVASISASVVPLTLVEQIQYSQLIADVTVTGSTIVEKGLANFLYTRYTFEIHEVLLGETTQRNITLDFGGGAKDDVLMVMGEVPNLIIGARYLIIVEDANKPLVSPIVGCYQGLYQAVPANGGELLVRNAGGQALEDRGVETTYDGFLSYLRSEIPYAKSLPLPNRKPLASSEPYILKNMGSKVWNTGSASGYNGGVRIPSRQAEPINNAPVPYEPVYQSPPLNIITEVGGDRLTFPVWWQPLPCIFNQLLSSNPSFPHDEWQMAYWNEYADMFRIMENPIASWAYGNRRNDMVGIVNDSTYSAIFGGHWGSTTLAMWFGYVNNTTHKLLESDIVVNDAYAWSLDSFAVYNDPNVWPLDQTLLHELGHAVGAPHNFEDLSVMNYAPKRYRSYNVLYRDDTASARAAYPASSVSIMNFSISSCRLNYVEGITTTGIIPGNPVVASGITIQNSGTQSGTAAISFYLCPTILSWDNAIYLGNLTLEEFNANTQSVLNNISYIVPAGTPPGDYHLGVLVTTANDEIGHDNQSWFHRPTQILPTPINGLWEGDVSGDWFDGQNWNDGNVPTINSTVTIPADTFFSPYIQSQYAECFSLTIEQEASLTVVNNILEVDGNLDNHGTIYLLEDANQLLINCSLTMHDGSSLIGINPLTTVFIGANLTVESGSNISSLQGRIEFFGSTDAFLSINDSNTVFNSITVNKFTSNLTYISSSTAKLVLMGNLGLGSYTTLKLESGQNTEIYGNLTGSDTSALIATNGKLKMCGYASQTIQVPALYSYLNHLEIASQGVVSCINDLTIKGDLTISAGVFEAPYNIYINGHWNNTLSPDAFTEGSEVYSFRVKIISIAPPKTSTGWVSTRTMVR